MYLLFNKIGLIYDLFALSLHFGTHTVMIFLNSTLKG